MATDNKSFLAACEKGNLDSVSRFVEEGVDVDCQNKDGVCGLFKAAEGGHSDTVLFLVKHGADVNIKNGTNGQVAVMVASKNGHSEVVKILLEHGADVNVQDADGLSALILASFMGHSAIVTCLLEYKASVNAQRSDGWSAIMFAALTKNKDIAIVLLKQNADVNIQNNNGATSLMIAAKSGCQDIVTLLIEYEANVNIQMDKGWSALMFAAENGYTKIALTLLEHGADVDLKMSEGSWSALHLASQNGHTETAKSLLDRGANVNEVTYAGSTALMIASMNGNIHTVEVLLSYDADTNMQLYENGMTALMLASVEGHTDAMKSLLERGADPNLQMKNGLTALMIDCQHESKEDDSVIILLDYKADVNIQMNDGVTALMIAIQNGGNTNKIIALLKYEANTNLRDIDGWSALMFASQDGYTDIVQLLLGHNTDVNAQDENGWSSLLLASQNGHTETLEVLLEHGANKNHQTHTVSGLSALMVASQKGHNATIKLLLKNRVDVNVKDNDGWTALMFASKMGYTECVETLLEFKANSSIRANNGWTALRIAVFNGHTEVITLLQESETELTASQFSYSSAEFTPVSYSGHGSYSPAISSGSFFRSSPSAPFSTHGSIRGSKYTLGVPSSGYGSSSPTSIDKMRYSPDLSGSPISNRARLRSSTVLDYWKLGSLCKCGETTVMVTNSKKEQFFSWANYGLNLHIMSHSLPPEILSCTIHIIATVIGNYKFPAKSHLVSPVFWIQCIPKCKFIKPVTLEIEHCAKQNNSDKEVRLYFVRANATQEQPYIFVKANGSSRTEHGIFPTQCTYGFIQLESFSGYGIVQEDSEERDYCANLYYIGQEESECQVHFAISWNTETHRSVVNDHYSKKGSESAAEQQIEFESDRITLDIPMTGVITENKGWKIMPLYSPVILKKEVDRFDIGKRIPACQMQATAIPSTILTDLHHIINLIGAKDPFNVFTLYRHSYKESNPVRIEWGVKRVQRPLQFGPRTEGSTSASATDISGSKTRKSSGFIGKLKKLLGFRVHDKPESGLSMSSSINLSPTKSASTLVLSSTQKDILDSTSTVIDSQLNNDLRVNTTDHEDVSTAHSALYQDKIETSSPKPPQLVILLRELTDEVSARWEDIGLHLNLKPGELEIIKKDNPGDSKACLREMLKLWIKQVKPSPSWSAIITAIKTCGYFSLARKLKQTYLPAVTITMS